MNVTTLDDLITERTRRPLRDPTVALTVRRLARVVAVPAFAAMLGGLGLMLAADPATEEPAPANALPGPSAVSLYDLTQPAAIVSGETAVSLGLLALAALPAMTVLFILVRHLIGGRWADAVVTAVLLAVLALGVLVG